MAPGCLQTAGFRRCLESCSFSHQYQYLYRIINTSARGQLCLFSGFYFQMMLIYLLCCRVTGLYIVAGLSVGSPHVPRSL